MPYLGDGQAARKTIFRQHGSRQGQACSPAGGTGLREVRAKGLPDNPGLPQLVLFDLLKNPTDWHFGGVFAAGVAGLEQ